MITVSNLLRKFKSVKGFNFPNDIDPAAIVSELVTTNSDRIQHRILTEPYDTSRKPPLFFKGSINETRISNYVTEATIPALSVTSFPRGAIIGNGIHLTQDDQPIISRTPMFALYKGPDSAQWLSYWTGGDSVEQLIERKRNENLNRHHIAAPCVCVGLRWVRNYGHWLFDFLPIVYMVQRFTKGPVKWIVPSVMTPWMKDLLDLFSIGPDQQVLYDPETEYITTENLIFVTCLHYGWFLHPMINSLIDQIFENSGIRLEKPHRTVFVSRARWGSSRQLVNYEEVESLFEEKGFTIIYPESLSPLEQIELFSQAKIVAGETGAGMNNTLFSPSSCDVLLLQSNARHYFNQAAICDVRGQRIAYVFGDSLDHKAPPTQDRFILDLKIVEEGIDELLAER